MWLTSRSLPMDAFFVFSGTLVSYSFMNGLSKGNKLNLPLHFIHRYLRLMPALAITLLINATLFTRLGSGPLWKSNSHRTEEECQNNWWKYLLFVNNWFPMHQVCLCGINETDGQHEKLCKMGSTLCFKKYIPIGQDHYPLHKQTSCNILREDKKPSYT